MPEDLEEVASYLFDMHDAQRSQDYAGFFKTSASLACLIMLSNKDYEIFKETPPDVLFLHCSGSITIAPPNAVIEGGDIKFSSAGKHISWPYYV